MWVFRSARSAPVRKAKKSAAGQAALDKLNSFLDAASPEPAYWLTRLWDDQQKAITYKELREAILSGGMSEKTLQEWQEDYAVFVNAHLKDSWTAAMKEAAAQREAMHPDFYFDPMTEGIKKWTDTKAAQLVTQVSDQQRTAIAALVGQGATGVYTVDELSRAIRPLVGLTKPQSLANLRFYQTMRDKLLKDNPTMKQATAEKRAQEAALKYAAKQHRQRAFDIAQTELAYAHNKGADEAVKQAVEQGYMGKTVRVWSTAANETVCLVCGALEGMEVALDAEFPVPGKGATLQTPPAHPRCKCALAYREVAPPAIPKEEQGAQPPAVPWAGELPPPEPAEVAPAIPPALEVPTGMEKKGAANMGNTGAIYRYVDADGNEWLFKPAQSKSGVPEAFRAHAQEAGYRVQYLVDPDTAVPMGTGTLDGKFGAFQPRLKGVTSGGKPFDLEWCQQDGQFIPQPLAKDLQREHVSDWLLGNYDAHGENFLMDESGRLIGLDKEQAFKFMGKKGAGTMSYGYHPNSAHGETEPIYNTMFQRFAKSEMDLDLQDTLAYIKRVESVPDAEYREIFRGYAESLKGKGKAAEELLDGIVERKSTLRETYRAFYSDLLTERTGKKQAFIWADEAVEHTAQPLAAVQMSPDVLGKMKLGELKQLAQQKQIPYFHNMTKTELVTAVADPVKAPAMSAQVKARLQAAEEARRAAKVVVPPKGTAREILEAERVFEDLSTVPVSRLGVPVASDKGMVEGLNLSARRMNIAGEEFYELSGKLSNDAWSKTWEAVKPRSETVLLQFESADDAMALFSNQGADMAGAKVRRLMDGEASFEVYVHSGSPKNALRGFFRVRVPVTGSGAADAASMRRMLGSVGLEDLTATPTAAAEELLKKSRLVWQNAPARVAELDGLTGDALGCKLDLILKQEGIDAARLGRMSMKKVFDGYSTLVEEGVAAEYEKAGAKFVWAGVSKADGVVDVLQGPGFMSTNNRFRAGIRLTGASPVADIASGGSDNVFFRLGVQGEAYNDSFLGEYFRIQVDVKELERTDWYAYTHDNFGNSALEEMAGRKSSAGFIQSMAGHYRGGNEIMFRQGVPKEHFIGISCESESLRKQLMGKLKAAGISEINGTPVEKFIFVSKEM